MRLTTLITIFFTLISNFAHATLFTVNEQQAIERIGQSFSFEFLDVPTPGSNGQFSITLNGDYSGFDTESSMVSIDFAGGILDLGAGDNGIISNTITGLTLNTYTVESFADSDRELSWIFNMSDILLSTIIDDGMITANVQNDISVDPLNRVDPDFVWIGFSYDVADPSSVEVPEPSSLSLFMLGVFGLGAWRRSQSKIKTQ